MSTRILVVEGAAVIQGFLDRHFKPNMVAVSYVADAAKAIELINGGRFDYIIADCVTSDMAPDRLVRVIAAVTYEPRVIVIAEAQAEASDYSRSLALAHSVNLLGILASPVDETQFVSLFKDNASPYGGPYSARETTHTGPDFVQSLVTDGLVPVFQPKKDIRSGRIVGAECFARWRGSSGGLLGASTILKFAREQGHMDLLTYRMIELALAQQTKWQGNDQPSKLWINVSSDNIVKPDFVDEVSGLVDQHGLRPGDITFEITEADFELDGQRAIDRLCLLRERGFGLALDDFGAGYAILLDLEDIPFGEVVIDRKFLTRAAGSEQAKVILEAAVSLAHKLDMVCTLEGVENEEQFNLARTLGADYVQGFYVGKPMAADDFSSIAGR